MWRGKRLEGQGRVHMVRWWELCWSFVCWSVGIPRDDAEIAGGKEATSELPTFEWEPEKIDCTSNHLGASAPDHSKKMDTKKNTHSHTGLPYIS